MVTTRALPAGAPQQLKLSALPALCPLEERAAVQLLRQRCPNLMEGDAALVAAVCERNALLLTLMGGFLAAGRCTVHHPQQASCPGCAAPGGRVSLCPAANAIAAAGQASCVQQPLMNPGPVQGIAGMDIRMSRGGQGAVAALVAKAGDFLGQHLGESELDVLARLSVWHSVAADLVGGGGAAGREQAVLEELQQLSVVRLAGGRYGLHPLVREAAAARLRSKQGLWKDAQRRLVEQMGRLGRRLRQQPTHSMAATRERLVAEGPNVQRVCAVLRRSTTNSLADAGVVLHWLADTQDLAWALHHCGLDVDARAVCAAVRHALA